MNITVVYSYLIDASAVIWVERGHGQGDPPMTNEKAFVA